MPTHPQTHGHIDEIAIYAKYLGASRLTLDGFADDEAFAALCKRGAQVIVEETTTTDGDYRTEIATLRLHQVELTFRRTSA